jgi:hypothetical protein
LLVVVANAFCFMLDIIAAAINAVLLSQAATEKLT